MDDFNISSLTETRNEYTALLITKLTPLVIQGIYSIYNDACKLCEDNEEHDKYLMTFQNFLARVPKWNQEIVKNETHRILKLSNCSYLEDLITCVHVSQLKILTHIRVGTKQKKLEIDIPDLNSFIHNIYIDLARNVYKNVFLFEKVPSLQRQKNINELSNMVSRSILNVIRNSMPLENIVKSYLYETQEETVDEVKEEVREEITKEEPDEDITKQNLTENNKVNLENESQKKEEEPDEDITKQKLTENNKVNLENESQKKEEEKREKGIYEDTQDNSQDNINRKIIVDTQNNSIDSIQRENNKELQESKQDTRENIQEKNENVSLTIDAKEDNDALKPHSIKFNDNDSVVDFNNTETPREIEKTKGSTVEAPKTIERLEQISYERDRERRENEEGEYDDDDDDDEKIKILDDVPVQLDNLDIHNIDSNINLKTDTDVLLDDMIVELK